MKQIYRFDCVPPPALSEKTLRAEIERRNTHKQTALFALAGILANWCLIIMAVMLYHVNAYLSIACASYIIIAMCGGGAIATVYLKNKRRKLSWLSL